MKPFLEQNSHEVHGGTRHRARMDQLPVTVVLDRNGNTVKRFDGLAKPEEIRAAIDKAQTQVSYFAVATASTAKLPSTDAIPSNGMTVRVPAVDRVFRASSPSGIESG